MSGAFQLLTADAAVVAQHAHGRRIEQEVAAGARRQPEPACGEDPEEVAVPEQRDISFNAANPGDDLVDAGRHLCGTLTPGQPSVNSIQPGSRA